MSAGGPLSERVLVLAPRGRDAALAVALLNEAKFFAKVVGTAEALLVSAAEGAGLAVVAEEAFRDADLGPLATWLAEQPPWSDFPFVLLTGRGSGPERNPAAARLWGVLGNVSFLERPFHPTTLISVVGAGLRSRRRQYEARGRLEEVRRGEEALRRANEMLEDRVTERTRALSEANAELTRQIAERGQVEAQLRQSQKVEALGQLTGGVAHDFNNLLMAVLGNLSLLRKRIPADDARAQRLIEGAVQGAQRGAALTHRLLAFARRQEMRPEPIDLRQLVEGMDQLLRRSLGPRIEVVMEAEEALPAALADANQLELALLNLAVNARDAMPDGGRLTIGIARAAGDRLPARLPLGQYLAVAVQDQGQGMSTEVLARAVEPFFSTKPVGQGTGLGLSMVHGVARQLGGDLQLTSKVGEGTTAEIFLPVATVTEHALATAGAKRDEAVPSQVPPARILLVDDDPLVLSGTADMLVDLGHTVVEAANAEHALAALRKGIRVDLMATDYAMPGMTGLELIEAARKLQPGLPVVLATGYAELKDGTTPQDVPRLAKPYRQDQLNLAISQALTGRTQASKAGLPLA